MSLLVAIFDVVRMLSIERWGMFSSPLDRKSEHVAWRRNAHRHYHRSIHGNVHGAVAVLSKFCRVAAGEYLCAINNFRILAPNFQRRRSTVLPCNSCSAPSNFAAHELDCHGDLAHTCELWLDLNIDMGQFMASMACT